MLKVVQDEATRQQFGSTIDEIARRGAELMFSLALEAEVDDYVASHRQHRDDRGHALVTRNGHARPRTIVSGAGVLGVRAPRVDDGRIDPATGDHARFASMILPPYMRRSPKDAWKVPRSEPFAVPPEEEKGYTLA